MNNEVKRLRTQLGLSAAQLADQMGVTANYIRKVERGDRRPSKTFMLLLHKVYEERRNANPKANSTNR